MGKEFFSLGELFAYTAFGAAIRRIKAQIIAITATSPSQATVSIGTTETRIQRDFLNLPFKILADKFRKTVEKFVHNPAKVQT